MKKKTTSGKSSKTITFNSLTQEYRWNISKLATMFNGVVCENSADTIAVRINHFLYVLMNQGLGKVDNIIEMYGPEFADFHDVMVNNYNGIEEYEKNFNHMVEFIKASIAEKPANKNAKVAAKKSSKKNAKVTTKKSSKHVSKKTKAVK